MSGSHVLVMAKAPVPGRVKTRLCPPCSPVEAAALAEAALADTLEAVAASAADRRVIALDGEPGPWLPEGFDVVPQCAGGFDARLTAAWAWAGGAGVQIGMDTPQATPALLDEALSTLDASTAALGPAADGGWWVIALRAPDPRVFEGIPMSTRRTGSEQLKRLRALGHEVRMLPTLVDLDVADDLAAVTAGGEARRTEALAVRLGLLPARAGAG
jgi:rSAM/selenodomain-associated transferase 1